MEYLVSMTTRVPEWRTDEVTPLSPHPSDPAINRPSATSPAS
jgi:muconolactone delta-isomerase